MRVWLPLLLLACCAARPAQQRPAAAPADYDWPMMRHDAANTAYTPHEVKPPLRLAWRKSVHKGVYPHPLASGGVIAVSRSLRSYTSYDNALTLVDLAGKPVWDLPNTVAIFLKNVVVVGVHTAASGAALEAWNWRKREKIWSSRLDPERDTAVLDNGWLGVAEYNGVLYVGFSMWDRTKYDHWRTLRAVRIASGETLGEWKTADDVWGHGGPAVNKTFVFAGLSHDLFWLDREKLQQVSSNYDAGNAYPMLVGDLIITQGWGEWMQAVRGRGTSPIWGARVWRENAHSLAYASARPVVIEALTNPQRIAALDVATGRAVWRASGVIGGVEPSLSATAGRYVYVPAFRPEWGDKRNLGGLYCLRAKDGKLLWAYEQPHLNLSTAIVAGGAVYALSRDGELFKFVPVR